MENRQDVDALRFDILRNAVYHTARRLFLDRCNRILNFIVIIAGAGAIGELLKGPSLAIVATVAATLQLVFDFGVRARDHEFLQRRYYTLLSEVDKTVAPTQEQTAAWRAELGLIYSEEPPPLRALDAIAYNSVCDSIGKSKDRVSVGFWQSLLRHVYPFYGTDFAPARSAAIGAAGDA